MGRWLSSLFWGTGWRTQNFTKMKHWLFSQSIWRHSHGEAGGPILKTATVFPLERGSRGHYGAWLMSGRPLPGSASWYPMCYRKCFDETQKSRDAWVQLPFMKMKRFPEGCHYQVQAFGIVFNELLSPARKGLLCERMETQGLWE